MNTRLRRRLPVLFSASLVGLTLAATAVTAAGRRDAWPRGGGGRLAGMVDAGASLTRSSGVALIDHARPDAPMDSEAVLAGRLAILGLTGETIRVAIDQLGVARGYSEVLTDEDILALAGDERPGTIERAKFLDLARAYLEGRPVSFVGIETTPDEVALVTHLVAREGADPDRAAWFALGLRTLQGDEELRRRAELAGALAGEPHQTERILEAARAIPAAGDVPADFERAPTGIVDLPGVSPVAQGFCRTCPSTDFAFPTPTTTYKTHAWSLGPGDCKIYRFTVTGGRKYRFTFCEGGGTATFDTMLATFATQCSAGPASDDSCGLRSQVDYDAPAAGYVYVRVSDKLNRGGTYTLAYKDAGPASTGCRPCPQYDFGVLSPTSTWRTHSSSFSSGGCRIYKFLLYLNRSYDFSFCDGGGTATFDTRLDTFWGNCALGPSNDDACAAGRSALSLTSTATQYLYVRVSANGPAGNYTLAYRDRTDLCQACPNFNYGTFTPTTNWAAHSASLTSARTCATYRFPVKSNEAYKFTFCEGGGWTTFDTTLTAFAYDGVTCAPIAFNDDSYCGPASDLEVAPGYDGFLYVQVGTASGATGNYRLAFTIQAQDWCTPPMFGPFTPALTYQTHASVLPTQVAATSLRVYAFDLVAGESTIFTMCPTDPNGDPTGASAAIDAGLAVFTPGCGGPVATVDLDCGAQPQSIYTAGVSGIHYLVVHLE